MIGREDEVRGYRDRVKIFHVLVLSMFLHILTSLFYLKFMKGEYLFNFAKANHLKKEKVQTTRGIIFDRNGKVIVDNRAAFDVVLLSQYFKNEPETNKRLAKALGISDE